MKQYKGINVADISAGIDYSMRDFLEKEMIVGYSVSSLHSVKYSPERIVVLCENDNDNRLTYSGIPNLSATHTGYLNDIQDDILNGTVQIYTY